MHSPNFVKYLLTFMLVSNVSSIDVCENKSFYFKDFCYCEGLHAINCLQRIRNLQNEFQLKNLQNFSCPIISSRSSEHECRRTESENETFFTVKKFLQRIASPEIYFRSIRTTAFKEKTSFEETTPLAFSVLCHANVGQLEALLASIFRPQNSYCVYVDAKSSPEFKSSVKNLVQIYKTTFPNSTIFLAHPTRRIYWSDVSILEAGLECLEKLMEENSKWKFFLNTVGSALPGFKITELTELLSNIEGDVIASIPMPEKVKKYVDKRMKLPIKAESVKYDNYETGSERKFQYHQDVVPFRTMVKKSPPPFGLKLFYNMTESVISRKTATFLLQNPIAKEFREWVQDIMAPEEFFYATLSRVNQSYAETDSKVWQDLSRDTTQGICPRFSNWDETTCKGKMKRWICNFSLEDLPSALASKCIWINKFDLHTDPRAISCLHHYLTDI